MQQDRTHATTFCSGIHIKQKLPAVPGAPIQVPTGHQRYRSRDQQLIDRKGNRAKVGRHGTEELVIPDSRFVETNNPMTPPSRMLSRKSLILSPEET